MAARKTPWDRVKKHLTLPRWVVDQVEDRSRASGSPFGSQLANDLRQLDSYDPPKPKAKPKRRSR